MKPNKEDALHLKTPAYKLTSVHVVQNKRYEEVAAWRSECVERVVRS